LPTIATTGKVDLSNMFSAIGTSAQSLPAFTGDLTLPTIKTTGEVTLSNMFSANGASAQSLLAFNKPLIIPDIGDDSTKPSSVILSYMFYVTGTSAQSLPAFTGDLTLPTIATTGTVNLSYMFHVSSVSTLFSHTFSININWTGFDDSLIGGAITKEGMFKDFNPKPSGSNDSLRTMQVKDETMAILFSTDTGWNGTKTSGISPYKATTGPDLSW
jgi:hypothetical protein